MDSYELPPDHLAAGSEYLDRLRSLGLDPEGLLWAYDHTIGRYVLVLITVHVDHEGPLALYRLLTKAYNASATPALVDPFIVRLHSPKQEISHRLAEAYGMDIKLGPFRPSDPNVDPTSVKVEITILPSTAGDLTFAREWVYLLRKRPLAPAERVRHWNRFTRQVTALAA